ncbi:MAG: cupin domain-containing protein [Muribaculaceae bacterium]|nr:cupin domain-containing protein [Muribaculaceae bacterium]
MLETEFKFGEVHVLADQIQTAEDRPQFRNIFSNGNGGVVLVGLKAGQKLDTHTAPAEVMVNVIQGEIEFTMLNHPHAIKAGEFLMMGADVAHSVYAKVDSKIMLVKVRP